MKKIQTKWLVTPVYVHMKYNVKTLKSYLSNLRTGLRIPKNFSCENQLVTLSLPRSH